jgi:hypothetical protein
MPSTGQVGSAPELYNVDQHAYGGGRAPECYAVDTVGRESQLGAEVAVPEDEQGPGQSTGRCVSHGEIP